MKPPSFTMLFLSCVVQLLPIMITAGPTSELSTIVALHCGSGASVTLPGSLSTGSGVGAGAGVGVGAGSVGRRDCGIAIVVVDGSVVVNVDSGVMTPPFHFHSKHSCIKSGQQSFRKVQLTSQWQYDTEPSTF